MRDNEDRFSDLHGGDSSAAVQATSSKEEGANLGFVSPTEFVDLPSKGKFYPKNHPLRDKTSLEIKFMTAKEEDILTNKSLIKKGVVVDRMLQSLIVDKNVSIEDMLLGDKNALIVASRVSGYGAKYEVSVTCPSCETKEKQVFNLENIEEKEKEEHSSLGVEFDEESALFCASLPRTKVKVEFRLLTGRDEKEMTSQMLTNKKQLEETSSTSQLRRIVVSVNGNTDRKVVENFVENMPAIDARYLRTLARKVSPDVNMEQEFSCSSCGHEGQMEVPFTVEFFWPK